MAGKIANMISSGDFFPFGGFIDCFINQEKSTEKRFWVLKLGIEVKTKWQPCRSSWFLVACSEGKRKGDLEVEFKEVFRIRGG